MAATIREAGSGDLNAVLPLYEWLFAPPGYKPDQWDEERAQLALAEAIVDPHAAVLIAEDAGELVGLCTAYLELNSVRYGQRCWVEDLAVDPERRSQGIGGALLDAAQDWARDSGATHFELDSGLARKDAHRFYDRRGEPAKGFSYSWPL
jgi:GNAT superfamily N-acetyltransferase